MRYFIVNVGREKPSGAEDGISNVRKRVARCDEVVAIVFSLAKEIGQAGGEKRMVVISRGKENHNVYAPRCGIFHICTLRISQLSFRENGEIQLL